MTESESRFRRWSARKAAARQDGKPKRGSAAPVLQEDAPVESKTDQSKAPSLPPLAMESQTESAILSPTAEQSATLDTDPEVSESEAFDRSALPDIDSLDAESDYTGFLKEGVPEQLQRQALRKLWRSNPVLANLDGLLDYGEDFTDSALVVEGMQTLYKVGKGYATDDETEDTEDAEAMSETASKISDEAEETEDSDRVADADQACEPVEDPSEEQADEATKAPQDSPLEADSDIPIEPLERTEAEKEKT